MKVSISHSVYSLRSDCGTGMVAGTGLEPMILGLQPSALPLGYGIIVGAGGGT